MYGMWVLRFTFIYSYILQQNKRTTGGKGQESGKRSRSEKTAKQWKPFLYKPRP
jgi:hypothetical protein